MQKRPFALAKTRPSWLKRLLEAEDQPTILPKSKTQRLALKAKVANIEAEKSMARAYQMEIIRAKYIAEAMFKSGKALRYSLISTGRQIWLTTQLLRRKYDPRNRSE